MADFNYNEAYYEQGIGGFHRESFGPITGAFREACPALGSDGSVLDFGCGNGFYGEFLRRLTPQLDGVDFSNVLPKVENRRYYRAFTQADLGRSWHPAQAYDVLFSIEVIEHVEDYRQFLANAFGALKPGGRLFLTTTTYAWSLFILLIVFRRQISAAALAEFTRGLLGNEAARTKFVMRFWDYFTGHYHGFTKRQLRAGLEQAGFTVEKLEYLHVQDMFPVRYLDQPYHGPHGWMVKTGLPILRTAGRLINATCRRFDLNAPNVLAVARKPEN